MTLTLELPEGITEGEALQFIKEGIARKNKREKKAKTETGELTPGQKAVKTYDWYCQRYPTYNNGKKYSTAYAPRDIKYLTTIFKADPTLTGAAICVHLNAYLQDKSRFHVAHGHSLNKFDLNAAYGTTDAKRPKFQPQKTGKSAFQLSEQQNGKTEATHRTP